MMRALKQTLLLSVVAVTFNSHGQVTPSYEGFGTGYIPNQTFGANATPGTNALVPKTGYTSNWLEIGTGAYPKSKITPNSLDYTSDTGSIITTGGALRLETNARLGREIAVNTGTGTIYFSFLYQLENTGTTTPEPTIASPYFGVEFWKNDAVQIKWRETPGFYSDGSYNMGSDRKFTIRGDSSTISFTGIDINAPLHTLGALDNQVNLIVFKLELTGIPGQDTISIWRNPDLNTNGLDPTPSQAQAFAQITNQNLKFNAISFANFFGNRTLLIDEIRFGNSFSQVINAVPIPEPSTYALLLLATITLIILRRTQKKA
ncbi:MAG: PEP-CTERM sorting domain-containing protein [Verrucomicrobiae bacterium]|nr:PEP-CTERM sorting domain-containing protein [Verrucomicrobiae bacterium]